MTMSHSHSSNFYAVDEFTFDYSLAMDQEVSHRRLGDISISFESSFTPGCLASTSVCQPGDYRHFPIDVDSQEPGGLVPHDSIFSTEETPGPVGIMPPLASDRVPTTSYPPQKTYSPVKLMTKKRTLDDPKQEGSDLKKAARKWEKMDQSMCSMRQIKGEAEYRCDICHKSKKKVITASYGDMQRHLQSWAH